MVFSPTVKSILVFTSIIFVLQLLSRTITGSDAFVTNFFALSYAGVVHEYRVWTIFTYMFLHGNFWHLLFNMLALFFFGSEIERNWGRTAFLKFYLYSGFGAGLIIFASLAVQALVTQNAPFYSTLGASGAIFAILLAYSLMFSERQTTLLIFFFIPITIKAKYLVLLIFGLTFVFSAFGESNISHVGHIGGIICGALFLLIYSKKYPFIEAGNELRRWLHLSRTFGSSFVSANKQRKNSERRRYSWRMDSSAKEDSNLDESMMSEREIEEKIDHLLEVISASGLRGLSDKEKQFLSRVSMLYRHKFPD